MEGCSRRPIVPRVNRECDPGVWLPLVRLRIWGLSFEITIRFILPLIRLRFLQRVSDNVTWWIDLASGYEASRFARGIRHHGSTRSICRQRDVISPPGPIRWLRSRGTGEAPFFFLVGRLETINNQPGLNLNHRNSISHGFGWRSFDWIPHRTQTFGRVSSVASQAMIGLKAMAGNEKNKMRPFRARTNERCQKGSEDRQTGH